MGSVCPSLEEDGGEPHARYKLMLFSRTRCPGKLGCADPMLCRALLLPSDAPDSGETKDRKHAMMQAPKFLPSWKACKAEIEMKAQIAISKVKHTRSTV